MKSEVKAVIPVFFLSLGLVTPFYSELQQTRRGVLRWCYPQGRGNFPTQYVCIMLKSY